VTNVALNYSLDPTWRRPKNGDVLIAGSPLRIFRLSTSGVRVAECLEQHTPVDATAQALVEKLLDAGAIHPIPAINSAYPSGPSARDITVVIPVYARTMNDVARIVDLTSQFSNLAGIIVVDDASPISLQSALGENVTLISLNENSGPGVARNAGLELVATSHVVFIDDDIFCNGTDVELLASWWLLDNTALLAPRVSTREWFRYGETLAAYEKTESPLDMGVLPARIRSGTKVSYVPSALLLCDVEALRKVGGFNPELRVGEDVDLVWRLDEAGYQCRYEPAVVVAHQPRTSVRAFVAQRYNYGTSASVLGELHPGALAPLKVSWWSLATWGSIVVGLPYVGAGIALTTAAMLARKVKFLPDANKESLRLAGLGHLHAGKQIASAITRTWLPIALLLAFVSRRARLTLVAAVLGPALIDWWVKRPRLDPVRCTLMRIVDDAAYSAGLWSGAVRRRNFTALKPDLTSWPSNSANHGPNESSSIP